jgi:hypothetical protein
MKFRKKPVIIEAVQLTWDNWDEMCVFAEVPNKAKGIDIDLPKIAMVIFTPDGTVKAEENDWIIRSVKGKLYPCKPDIFEKTYEPVEEEK